MKATIYCLISLPLIHDNSFLAGQQGKYPSYKIESTQPPNKDYL